MAAPSSRLGILVGRLAGLLPTAHSNALFLFAVIALWHEH